MTFESTLANLQRKVWSGSIPFEIRLSNVECRVYDRSDPYLLHAFFQSALIDPTSEPRIGWFSFQDVPLHWHYPTGLLYDLYSGAKPHFSTVRRHIRGSRPSEERDRERDRPASQQSGAGLGMDDNLSGRIKEISLRDLDDVVMDGGYQNSDDVGKLPWKLVVHFSDYPMDALIQLDKDGKALEDVFINSVKEASFARHGSGKVVMSLGENDSKQLWKSVEQNDLLMFNAINNKLLNAPGATMRSIPFRVFLPTTSHAKATLSPTRGSALSAPPGPAGSPVVSSPNPGQEATASQNTASILRMIQRLLPPTLAPSSRQGQTLGTALHSVLPTLFPSRRQPVLAWPVIHGAVVPMAAPLEELGKWASYADGWVTVGVVMME
ncbi:hypothetical protein P152DRAFT_446930 [Eremomyces bilateralis CBS 781.70]|uniref:Autophagy protein 5 n=1 Tax=Eremomyces bilateralis CBS 781.70 TaxID=1392243 RepID=A0A6G1GD26_9PEZI|nr:uncharacterized protein P152DRAFT_446930 [Eremomyces bilateralis CBS 781.70]KAF1815934.1 hypothetical protein P152DRAFT_446930 [Eremomyces bilateralis CBS 781.70]